MQLYKEVHTDYLASPTDDLILLVDEGGLVTQCFNKNPASKQIMDHRMVGENWMDVFGCDDQNLFFDALSHLKKGYQTAEFSYAGTGKYSSQRYLVKCNRIPGTGKEIASCLLFFSEVNPGQVNRELAGSHFDMHTMVTRIAMDFANITLGDLKQRTEAALADIGHFTGADRVYVFSYDFNNRVFSNTHEWCAEGISREIDMLQNQPLDYLAELVDQHLVGKNVYLQSVGDLPANNKLRKLLEDQGIKSIITIPMMYDSECFGFVGLDSVHSYRKWDDNEIQILRLFADLLATTENRIRNERRLKKSENRNKALLGALPDLIFRVSRDGIFLDVHAADHTDLLAPPDTLPGKHLRDVMPDAVATRCLEHLEEVFSSGKRVVFEYELPINGTLRNYEARVVKSDHDEVLLVIRNISERIKNNERLHHITKNIPGAIYTFTLSPDGSYHLPYISDSIEELSGVRADVIKSDFNQVLNRIHSDDIQTIFTTMRSSAQTMCKWSGEFRIKNHEENWIWIQAESTPQRGSDGSIVWYGHIRDINDQKEAECQLAYERDMMNSLMETIPDQIYFKDLNSRFIRINKATANRFGFDRTSDMMGKSDVDFFNSNYADKTLQDEQKIIKTGKPVIGIEEKEVWPDGRVTWASTTKMPLYNRDRKVIGTYGISRDITERKNSEEVIRQREAYLSAVIENQNGLIWLKDLAGRFILVNKKFAHACNFSNVDEMTGKTEHDINPSNRARKYIREDQKVIKTGKTLITQEKKTSGSKEVWFETYKSPVRSHNGKIIGTTGYSLDITDRKKKVEQVRQLNRKLNDINIQKDKLFSILAHDLRNPFAGSIGMLEMILTESNNISESELQEYIQLLYNNTVSTYSLVENLLEWSRTQREQMNHTPDDVDLRTLLDQTYQVVAGSAHSKQIELLNEVPVGTTVFADRDMLHTILRNLITNGIKFTRPGGNISVGAKFNTGSVQIEVKDNGIGIREEERAKLFRIDYQPCSHGTNGEKGSGLGLQICKDFTEIHGGNIAVESEPGNGSTFSITLPNKPARKR
ncbi:MAG: PAS domain S-box protein [Balneolaceae bacterium]|nr:MAG: PAS domain S-box protein [Balneolaceae bacterium]